MIIVDTPRTYNFVFNDFREVVRILFGNQSVDRLVLNVSNASIAETRPI